jgi:organic hydroperoxide reductase OsmC/OhrA
MEHQYTAFIEWTGNSGHGTRDYKSYGRDHTIHINNKPDIAGSSDPAFRGDRTRHNPEDLFVSSLASCHMLWYLHLCATHKVVVIDYKDKAIGVMKENKDGSGSFTEITLYPVVTVTEQAMVEKALSLHQEANRMCFIANSVKCPVYHKPEARVASLA